MVDLFCVACGAPIDNNSTGRGAIRTKYCSKSCCKSHAHTTESYKDYKKKYDVEYRKKHKDKINKRRREAEYTPIRAYQKKISGLKSKFGLSETEYLSMLDEQKGLCLVCGDSLDNLAVDHCHTTGRVRGLLCKNCNSAIGLLREDVDILENAIIYLKENKRTLQE